ncbi:MAG: hypothetical protein HWE39_13455 [Oceanospirillaceae bacterium]|nr:hypothetical protein [Oceanospirillaceae bacterium]
MMQERRRHQYLDALGIPSWLPRAPLPGARPSADWVWSFRHGDKPADDSDFFEDDVAEAVPSPVSRPVSSGVRPQPSGAGRSALLDSLGADTEARKPGPKPPPAKPATVPAAVAETVLPEQPAAPLPPVAAQEVPEFKLAFLTIGDALLIDSLPPQSRGFTSAHQRLSVALVRALGVNAEQPSAAQMLPWPVFASRTLDQGWAQAEAAVQRKLGRMTETSPPRFLLLLGEAAAQLVLRTREAGDGLRGTLFHPCGDVPALASASLSEMLQIPGCKRDVWRDLQPLVRALADG